MIYRFPIKIVRDMLLNQVSNFFFKSIEDEALISKHLPKILDRLEINIAEYNNKYYETVNEKGEKESYFNPLHSDQWSLFLYLSANTIFHNEKEKEDAARVLCDKIYNLLKLTSGCDLYYEVDMPDRFVFEHPMGSCFCRAKIGDGFFFENDCVVSASKEGTPTIGRNVTMKFGSSIVGKAIVGDNCYIEAGTAIINQVVPDNCVVSGESPNLVIKMI